MSNRPSHPSNQLFKRGFQHLLLVSFVGCAALLAACGSNTDDSNTQASTTAAPQSQQLAASDTSSVSLLSSLAQLYPNGQLPAGQQASASEQLAQNPAVLKMSANTILLSKTNSTKASLSSMAISTDTGSYSPVYRIQNNNLPGAYFFTIFDSERYAALTQNPSWKLEGAAFYTATTAADGLSPVYRFRNKTNGSYVYTIFEEEYQSLLANYSATFVLEGVSWYARQSPAAGYTPLYRFRNKTNGTYLFSAYESEKNSIVANYAAIFEFEGVSYYVNTTDTNPDCSQKLPEKTLATLPTSYSAKLLESSFDQPSDVYLTNTGYVAWLSQCSYPPCGLGQTGARLYSSMTDTIMQRNALGNEYISLVSLNDAGVALINESSSLPPSNQSEEISTLPFAKLWDGVTATDSIVRAPNKMKHRAGRHTFSLPMGGVNDGSGRKWAYPDFPSYLDGAKLVNTSATLSLGNFPGAVNRCGTAVTGYGPTQYGLNFSRGTLPVNSMDGTFTANSNAYPQYNTAGLTDTATSFGFLSSWPFVGPSLGFIKTATAQRYFPNSEIKDVNDSNTGVGYGVVATTVIPISYIPQEGQILASDGAQSLKPLVPGLAASADILIPKAINNSGQIVVATCTMTSYGFCAATGSKLYLLTPQ